MRNCSAIAIVSVSLFLNSCATNSAYDVDHDERIDVYLSTLDDKHFAWCNLDLNQCQADFDRWKATSRGRAFIKEYEKEKAGQTDNIHHVPDVFRTQYVKDAPFIEREEKTWLEDMKQSPKMFGPELPSKY